MLNKDVSTFLPTLLSLIFSILLFLSGVILGPYIHSFSLGLYIYSFALIIYYITKTFFYFDIIVKGELCIMVSVFKKTTFQINQIQINEIQVYGGKCFILEINNKKITINYKYKNYLQLQQLIISVSKTSVQLEQFVQNVRRRILTPT